MFNLFFPQKIISAVACLSLQVRLPTGAGNPGIFLRAQESQPTTTRALPAPTWTSVMSALSGACLEHSFIWAGQRLQQRSVWVFCSNLLARLEVKNTVLWLSKGETNFSLCSLRLALSLWSVISLPSPQCFRSLSDLFRSLVKGWPGSRSSSAPHLFGEALKGCLNHFSGSF